MGINNHKVIKLTQELIKRDSITPNDKGCQQLLANLLEQTGFKIEHKRFGDVDNLFAWHGEKPGKSLMFLGHTDVVPVGDESQWQYPPFSAEIVGDYLHSRGTADMKGGVAAFTLAIIDYVENNPEHNGKVSLMLTSDEEGIAQNGIKKMMPFISKTHSFDYCIVGEPSSSKQLGDVVRIGRRGSLHVEIVIHGKQGHVAYPQNAKNPIFLAAGFIDELSAFQWDKGNDNFPPTSFQISSVSTSSNTSNIIPADLKIQANFRYNPDSDDHSLNNQLQALLDKYQLSYSLKWSLSGLPFYSKSKDLKLSLQTCIEKTSKKKPVFNTEGGTSDGRFVAPFAVDVVELGVINKTIHQVGEMVLVKDLVLLNTIYKDTIIKLLK